jgi:mono/diheme cytochrome c family protein
VSAIFQEKCVGCHGDGGRAGLNLTSYQTALKGSDSGPVIVPGSPDQSMIVKKQSSSSPHYGQLTPEELALVTQWIQAGAPEK